MKYPKTLALGAVAVLALGSAIALGQDFFKDLIPTAPLVTLPIQPGANIAAVEGGQTRRVPGNFARSVTRVTTGVTASLAPITANSTTVVWASPTTGAKTSNIPACAAALDGVMLTVLDGQQTAATYPIAVTPASGTIGPTGAANYSIATNGGAPVFVCDGAATRWQLTSGATGGAGNVTAAGTLTSNALVLGGGTQAVVAMAGLGTSGQVLTSAGAGAPPTWAAATGGGSGTVGNCTTAFAVAYYGATGTVTSCLGSVGTTGQVLTSAGAGAVPTWTTPAAAAGRTANGDSNYTILTTDSYIVTSASLTAPRVWTLPAAGSVPAGTTITIEDEFGGVSSTNTIAITPNGTNTINGVNNASNSTIGVAYGGYTLKSFATGWSVTANTIQQAYSCSGATFTTQLSAAGVTTCSTLPGLPLGIGWLAGSNPTGAIIANINQASTVTAIVGAVEAGVGAAATVSVRKASSGTTCAAGTVLHSGSFDANGTAGTNQVLPVTTSALAAGDRLCLLTTGTTSWTSGTTGIGGITVFVRPN